MAIRLASRSRVPANRRPTRTTRPSAVIRPAVSAALLVRWAATHDAGTLADWYAPSASADGFEGGGEFNDTGGTSVASTEQAHGGTTSAKLTLDAGTGGSDVGVRLVRWLEPRTHREAYYEAWYYLPDALTMTQSDPNWPYCILMQFKSRNQDESRNDPFWLVQLKPPPHSGSMRLQLYWWGNMVPADGPHSGESGGRAYDQALADVPTATWFRLRCWLKQSSAGQFDGVLKVWQDDTLLFDLSAIRTGYDNNAYGAWGVTNDWACTLYSNGLDPLPATVYVDDARIATDQ